MQFTPVSDDQLAADAEERRRKAQPWKPGEYEYEIKSAEETVSKIKPDGSGGNPMLVLNIKVYNSEGEFKMLNDYLLEASPEKLKRAAYSCGLGERYESGELQAYEFEGRGGSLTLRVRRQVGYPDKNEIEGYIANTKAPVSKPEQANATFDDKIPF